VETRALSVGRLLVEARQRLGASPAAPLEAEILLMHLLQVDRAWLFANREHELPARQSDAFRRLIQRRTHGEPIAYLTGVREFWSLPLRVTPDVLIPRPETELLVETALAFLPPHASWRVADLGTGSGAVAIAIAIERPACETIGRLPAPDPAADPWRADCLPYRSARVLVIAAACHARRADPASRNRVAGGDRAGLSSTACVLARGGPRHRQRPACEIHATESSAAAIAVARANVDALAKGRVTLHRGSWLEPLSGRFHLIVSNPPYVAEGDRHLETGDCRFEPRMALTPGPDGMAAIRQIARDAPSHLEPGGLLAFEHGYDQGAAARSLLRELGYCQVATRRDLEGRERVTSGRRADPD